MPVFTQPPEYFSHFLGLAPEESPHFWKNISGSGGIGWRKFYGPNKVMNGGVNENHASGGTLPLWTCAWGQTPVESNAGLRLGNAGGPPGTTWVDERNWNPRLGLVFEALLYLSSNVNVSLSAGFVGFGDVPNVVEFYFDAGASPTPLTLQVSSQFAPGATGSFSTGFVPQPFFSFLLRLDVIGSEVKAYINDELAGSYDGPCTPQMMLVPEFLIGNALQPDNTWSRPFMAIDYLGVKQLSR